MGWLCYYLLMLWLLVEGHGFFAVAVALWRPSPKGCREAERPEQSDGDSERVNCTFVMFMKQSICRDNPSALHNSVACEDAGSACARFVCTQPYQDS